MKELGTIVIQRRIDLMKGELFFSPGLPLYVNRSVESFDLHEHRHDFLEISYVSEGSGTHMMGNSAVPVTQGDIFRLPVGTSHVFRPASTNGKEPLIVYNCLLDINAFTMICRSFPGGNELLPLLMDDHYQHYKDHYGEFQRLFQQLHHEYRSDRCGREIALYSTVFQLLLFLHRLENEPEGGEASLFVRLESVLNDLHTRFSSRITVAGMAQKMGLSERQFHRIFQKQTGMNMTVYLQNVRIHAACNLLQTTERKISDIAAAVGYQDLSYFHTIFRKKVGLSPQTYRRSLL